MNQCLRYLLVGSVCIASASGQCGGPRSKDAVTATSISLRTDQPTVKIGTPIFVIVTVTNKSDHDVMLFLDSKGADIRLPVVDSMNRAPAETHLGARLHGHLRDDDYRPDEMSSTYGCLPLKAGASTEMKMNVTSRYVFTDPGTYTIRAERGDTDSTELLKSNPVKVTLVK